MNFVRALQQEGHEVHTIAPVDSYTHYLEEEGCIHHRVRMDSRGANVIKDSALIFELFMIYKKVRPDIVLHYTIKPNVYGTLAASMLRIPTINNVCGLGTVFLKDNLVSFIAVLLYKVSFRFASRVFFQNQDDLNLFVKRRLVPKENVDLLPGSGIDLKKFTPFEYTRNTKFTFLLISRLISDKGIFEYVSAVKKLREEGTTTRFQILGAMDPEHKRGIKTEIINEWINSGTIEYLGTTDNVREHIEKADCIVLPSYREGTPRTLLEAASSSKPIIATDVPGCNNVVTDGENGLLCELKNADDLADKMREMAVLPDDILKEMGRKGRTKMEAQFNENRVIEKYLNTLSEFRKVS